MTLRIPNEGEDQMIGVVLGKYSAETLRLKLFSNDFDPALNDTATAASFIELTGGGYAAIDLVGANWTITQGNPTVAAYPVTEFVFSGATPSIYGYYIVGVTSGKVYVGERFTNGPYAAQIAGDKVQVTVNLSIYDTGDA